MNLCGLQVLFVTHFPDFVANFKVDSVVDSSSFDRMVVLFIICKHYGCNFFFIRIEFSVQFSRAFEFRFWRLVAVIVLFTGVVRAIFLPLLVSFKKIIKLFSFVENMYGTPNIFCFFLTWNWKENKEKASLKHKKNERAMKNRLLSTTLFRTGLTIIVSYVVISTFIAWNTTKTSISIFIFFVPILTEVIFTRARIV